jgi:hypothetical protein
MQRHDVELGAGPDLALQLFDGMKLGNGVERPNSDKR